MRGRSLRRLSILLITIGFILILCAGVWNPLFNLHIKTLTIERTRLADQNGDRWKDIPGLSNTNIYHKIYLYDCKEKDEVIYSK